jgi:hypothetical protein
MISKVQELDVVEVLSFLARKKTISEVMFGNEKLPVMSVEERIAEMGRRRTEHDAIVLKARGLVASMGIAL